jgi:hypothetical protein
MAATAGAAGATAAAAAAAAELSVGEQGRTAHRRATVPKRVVTSQRLKDSLRECKSWLFGSISSIVWQVPAGQLPCCAARIGHCSSAALRAESCRVLMCIRALAPALGILLSTSHVKPHPKLPNQELPCLCYTVYLLNLLPCCRCLCLVCTAAGHSGAPAAVSLHSSRRGALRNREVSAPKLNHCRACGNRL